MDEYALCFIKAAATFLCTTVTLVNKRIQPNGA
jgi:hypothetical protein